jgi:hypothetical protein
VATFWQTVWTKIKDAFKWVVLKIGAPGVALLVVIGAILLVLIGCKGLQIGGLLAKILGKPDALKAIDVVNSIPKKRVDANGNLIPIGVPDSGGNTQVQVVPIDSPGLFSNPTTVTFTPPGETKPVEVKLPDGIRSSDVDTVVVVSPTVTVVTVKDSSGLTVGRIDDLLKKYGG